MANAWPLTVGAALLLAACGVRDVQPAAVVIGAPARWVDVDRLPTSTRAEPLQTALPVFELELRAFPGAALPDNVRADYIEQFGELRTVTVDLFDVVHGDRVLYSPLAPVQPCIRFGPSPTEVRKGRPDYWWRLDQALREDFLPYLGRDAAGRPQGIIRLRANARVPYKLIARIAEVLSREGIGLWRMELVVRTDGDDEMRGVPMNMPGPWELRFEPPDGWEEEFFDEDIVWAEGEKPGEPGNQPWHEFLYEVEMEREQYGWSYGWSARFRGGFDRLSVIHPGMSAEEVGAVLAENPGLGELAVILASWPLYGEDEPDLSGVSVQGFVETWDAVRALTPHVWFWP